MATLARCTNGHAHTTPPPFVSPQTLITVEICHLTQGWYLVHPLETKLHAGRNQACLSHNQLSGSQLSISLSVSICGLRLRMGTPRHFQYLAVHQCHFFLSLTSSLERVVCSRGASPRTKSQPSHRQLVDPGQVAQTSLGFISFSINKDQVIYLSGLEGRLTYVEH